MIKKQIIALGGGGFSMEPENLALDTYILQQSEKTNPRVCFVPTASADSVDYQLNFYKSMRHLPCQPSVLHLLQPTIKDFRAFVLSQDIIYVGGGNTKNLMALWQAWGLDKIFREAWEKGIILAGISAGAICWFEQGSTDSVPGKLTGLPCLGFLPGSCAPHFDGEADRRPSYHQMILNEEICDGIGVDDGCAVHYIDTKIHAVVASREGAAAYDVYEMEGGIMETKLESTLLDPFPIDGH